MYARIYSRFWLLSPKNRLNAFWRRRWFAKDIAYKISPKRQQRNGKFDLDNEYLNIYRMMEPFVVQFIRLWYLYYICLILENLGALRIRWKSFCRFGTIVLSHCLVAPLALRCSTVRPTLSARHDLQFNDYKLSINICLIHMPYAQPAQEILANTRNDSSQPIFPNAIIEQFKLDDIMMTKPKLMDIWPIWNAMHRSCRWWKLH